MDDVTAKILERLETLYRKEDGEGNYVRANTVALAIEEIKRLSTQTPKTERHP